MKRAKIHLDALDKAVAVFRSKPEESHRISSYDDLDNGFFVIEGKALNIETAMPLGLIAGDFICNLRSSLDYLAWQLANLTPNAPSRDTSFPIFGKNSLDAQLKITKSCYGIPEEAISLMKSFQPYHTGDAYQSSHLWRLHTLWNIDKHRNIFLHSLISDEFLRLPRGMAMPDWKPLDDGAVMRIPLSAKEHMSFNPRPGVDVQFGDDEQGVVVTLLDFKDMYDFVSVEVVPKFSRFFT